jgi:hypothetical protein
MRDQVAMTPGSRTTTGRNLDLTKNRAYPRLSPNPVGSIYGRQEKPAMAQQHPSEEQIRIRAYEIFLRRGGADGSPEQDWLLAETELLSEVDGEANGAPASASPKSPAAAKAAPVEAPPKRSVRTVRGSTTASRRSR